MNQNTRGRGEPAGARVGVTGQGAAQRGAWNTPLQVGRTVGARDAAGAAGAARAQRAGEASIARGGADRPGLVVLKAASPVVANQAAQAAVGRKPQKAAERKPQKTAGTAAQIGRTPARMERQQDEAGGGWETVSSKKRTRSPAGTSPTSSAAPAKRAPGRVSNGKQQTAGNPRAHIGKNGAHKSTGTAVEGQQQQRGRRALKLEREQQGVPVFHDDPSSALAGHATIETTSANGDCLVHSALPGVAHGQFGRQASDSQVMDARRAMANIMREQAGAISANFSVPIEKLVAQAAAFDVSLPGRLPEAHWPTGAAVAALAANLEKPLLVVAPGFHAPQTGVVCPSAFELYENLARVVLSASDAAVIMQKQQCILIVHQGNHYSRTVWTGSPGTTERSNGSSGNSGNGSCSGAREQVVDLTGDDAEGGGSEGGCTGTGTSGPAPAPAPAPEPAPKLAPAPAPTPAPVPTPVHAPVASAAAAAVSSESAAGGGGEPAPWPAAVVAAAQARAAPPAPLSAYEIRRAANVARNAREFSAAGLGTWAKIRTPKKPGAPRTKRVASTPGSLRRSTRGAGRTPPDYTDRRQSGGGKSAAAGASVGASAAVTPVAATAREQGAAPGSGANWRDSDRCWHCGRCGGKGHQSKCCKSDLAAAAAGPHAGPPSAPAPAPAPAPSSPPAAPASPSAPPAAPASPPSSRSAAQAAVDAAISLCATPNTVPTEEQVIRRELLTKWTAQRESGTDGQCCNMQQAAGSVCGMTARGDEFDGCGYPVPQYNSWCCGAQIGTQCLRCGASTEWLNDEWTGDRMWGAPIARQLQHFEYHHEVIGRPLEDALVNWLEAWRQAESGGQAATGDAWATGAISRVHVNAIEGLARIMMQNGVSDTSQGNMGWSAVYYPGGTHVDHGAATTQQSCVLTLQGASIMTVGPTGHADATLGREASVERALMPRSALKVGTSELSETATRRAAPATDRSRWELTVAHTPETLGSAGRLSGNSERCPSGWWQAECEAARHLESTLAMYDDAAPAQQEDGVKHWRAEPLHASAVAGLSALPADVVKHMMTWCTAADLGQLIRSSRHFADSDLHGEQLWRCAQRRARRHPAWAAKGRGGCHKGYRHGPIVILPQRRPSARPEQRSDTRAGGRGTCKRPLADNGIDGQPLPPPKKAPGMAPVEQQQQQRQQRRKPQQGQCEGGDSYDAARERSVRGQLHNVCDPETVNGAIAALKEKGCVVEPNAVLDHVFAEGGATDTNTAGASRGGSAASAPAGGGAAAAAPAKQRRGVPSGKNGNSGDTSREGAQGGVSGGGGGREQRPAPQPAKQDGDAATRPLASLESEGPDELGPGGARAAGSASSSRGGMQRVREAAETANFSMACMGGDEAGSGGASGTTGGGRTRYGDVHYGDESSKLASKPGTAPGDEGGNGGVAGTAGGGSAGGGVDGGGNSCKPAPKPAAPSDDDEDDDSLPKLAAAAVNATGGGRIGGASSSTGSDAGAAGASVGCDDTSAQRRARAALAGAVRGWVDGRDRSDRRGADAAAAIMQGSAITVEGVRRVLAEHDAPAAVFFVVGGLLRSEGAGADGAEQEVWTALDGALQLARSVGAEVLVLERVSVDQWRAWAAEDAGPGDATGAHVGAPCRLGTKPAVVMAKGALAGFYLAAPNGTLQWTKTAPRAGGPEPEWLTEATKQAPAATAPKKVMQYRAVAGSAAVDVLDSAAGGKKLTHKAARGVVALTGAALADWVQKDAATRTCRGADCRFTRFATATMEVVGVRAGPAGADGWMRKQMVAATKATPLLSSWDTASLKACFTQTAGNIKAAFKGVSSPTSGSTGTSTLRGSSVTKDMEASQLCTNETEKRLARAILTLTRVLARAEEHRNVPSAGADTGPALARAEVHEAMSKLTTQDFKEGTPRMESAIEIILYWQHQLVVAVARWTAPNVPDDPAGAVKAAKTAGRAKGRRHLPKKQVPPHVPPIELSGTAAVPLVEMFPKWAGMLKRLRAVLERDPGLLRGADARPLPLRFTRFTGEVTADGMNWLLDLALSKDPRATEGFKYDLYDFETDDGDGHAAMFQKVASMGEPGSSQGLGVWSDDYMKHQAGCAAGIGAQRSMMRLASLGASQRSPAYEEGVVGDADLIMALILLWPTIALGGIDKRVKGDLQGHKAATRVRDFYDGKWGKWLNVIEGKCGGRPRTKSARSKKQRVNAAKEKISIGALSKGNAELNANDDLRCPAPDSEEGMEGFKQSFGQKHQVVGGELGEDSRAELHAQAQGLDAAAASAYAGATAGYPVWAMLHVLHPHMTVYLCKAKDNARAKKEEFYRLDRKYQQDKVKRGSVQFNERAARMASLVSAAMRPIMVPTPLLRFHQRIDVVAHKKEIRAAFDAYQYCACMPGGTENMSWLARLCWDQGIPFLMADVPNGFPGAKLGEVYEAVKEVLPVMVPSFLRWCENGYRAYNQDGDLMDEVVGGMPQGDPLIPIFFGALMVHKMKQTEAALKSLDGEAPVAKAQALALFYADDGLITHPEPAQMLRYRKHFKGELASKDDVYVSSRQTRAEVEHELKQAGFDPADWGIVCSDYSSQWTTEQEAQAAQATRAGRTKTLPIGVRYLGVPIGNACYVEEFVMRKAQGDKRDDVGSVNSAMDHVRSLVQLAGSAQERLLLLRHCVATKLTHIARFASAELYERATRELQDAIEDEIRAIAKALPSEFGGDAMRLARMPLSMGGLGITKMTKDSAAVAAMCSAASALARLEASCRAKRPDATWAADLMRRALDAGGGAHTGEPAVPDARAQADGASGEDGAEAGAGGGTREPTGAQLDAHQKTAEAIAEAAETALASLEQLEREKAGRSDAGQTVECTLAKGWAVAARRRARVAALRGKARKRHEDLTTTVIRSKASGAEPRKVAHAIPRTFGDLVHAAAKDNNKLQMKVNVHEHALDWIRIYEGSKHNKATICRLNDLLLTGTSAVFTAIPSCTAMQVGNKQLAFRLRMQFGLKAKLSGFYSPDAYELACTMAKKEQGMRHDATVDAFLSTAVASNLVACREPEKHFECHNGTGTSVTPDGVIVLEDGTVVGIDVCYAGTAAAGKSLIETKKWGRGVPSDRSAAMAARAQTMETVAGALKRGDITAREAQEARYDIALKVKSSYHPGYVRPLELGGADFLCVCLSYFGGWRSPVGEVMPKLGHTGDGEPTHSHKERYGSRTWGDSTHKQACLQAITVATVNATYDWMANKARRVLEDVLDVRAHDRRPKVPPPVAQAGRANAGVEREAGARAAA